MGEAAATDAAKLGDDRGGRRVADDLVQIVTPDEERWAEALAIERAHGADSRYFIAARLAEVALAGDKAGVTRLQEIAVRLDQLRSAGSGDRKPQ